MFGYGIDIWFIFKRVALMWEKTKVGSNRRNVMSYPVLKCVHQDGNTQTEMPGILMHP